MLSEALVAPAWQWVPEHVGSYGPEVADWADSCGLTLDGEQRLVLDALYAYGETGQLVATEAGVVCARQNLKTHVLLTAALADLFLFDEPGCMWTAHMRPALVDPTSGAFSVCKRVIESNAHLSRYVRNVSETDGEEGIELVSGASLEFRLRSARAGRALTGRRITLDEALYLNAGTLGALVPVLSAQSMKADVQLRYGSSAGKAESAVLRGVRDRGRAGGHRRLTYFEWAARYKACASEDCSHAPGADGCALDDLELLHEGNPALYRRISPDFVLETERAAMTPAEFMRERFSWWEDPVDDGAGSAFDRGVFAGLADADARREGARCRFALAAAPDRSWCAIAVAWRRPDGLLQVLLLDYRPGTAWVAGRVAQLREEHGAHGPVVANTAARGLLPADVVVEPGQQAQAEAHGALRTAVEGGTFRHGGEPALLTALRGARWRAQGDTQALDRKGETDISPLDAAALVLHALASAPASAPSPQSLEPTAAYERREDLSTLGF